MKSLGSAHCLCRLELVRAFKELGKLHGLNCNLKFSKTAARYVEAIVTIEYGNML